MMTLTRSHATAVVAIVTALAACGGDEGGGSGAGGTSAQGGSSTTSGTTTGTGTTTTSSTTGGSGGCAPAPEGCFDYCSFSPTPGVSFEDDVMPIFAAHCSSTSCHGSLSTPDADLYLGNASGNDTSVASEVYAELSNWDAYNAPGMVRVDPGDPENSWLMVKLDGDMGCPQAQPFCAGSCGQRMPRGEPALTEGELTTIRSWIANGAQAPGGF
jgi:hypothetical protein